MTKKKTKNLEFDLFYLKEDRKKNIKESFKFIIEKAKVYLDSLDEGNIADIGCATGDLLYYIHSLYPHLKLQGYDIQNELLEKAKQEVPQANFDTIDITSSAFSPTEKYNAVFMCGVHATFDSPDEWLPNFLQLLKPGGRGYVYGNFNPEPIDVIVKVRKSGDTGPYMSNWNMLSQQTFKDTLDRLGYDGTFFHFQINIDLPKREESPLRSWTFKYQDGTRGTINGAQLLHQDYLMEIKKK